MTAAERRSEEPAPGGGGELSLLHLCCPNQLCWTPQALPSIYTALVSDSCIIFFLFSPSGSTVIHVKAPSHFPSDCGWLWVTVLCLCKHFPILHWKQNDAHYNEKCHFFPMENYECSVFTHPIPTFINYNFPCCCCCKASLSTEKSAL